MAIAADARNSPEPSLEIRGVLRDTTRIYRSLFVRSFATGFAVFAVLGLLDVAAQVADTETTAIVVVLVATLAAFVGTTFVQGALVDAVDSEHRGVPVPPVGDLYQRSWSRLGALVELSIRTGFGVAFGLLLLIVPGVLLAIRWALAAPVVMLEGVDARGAMRRSRELVQGHRGAVFRVLLNVWGRVAVVWILLGALFSHLSATSGHPLFFFWLGGALASALVTPYAGHALSVVYYRLTDPGQPVLNRVRRSWESIWQEQEAPADRTAR
jgi:hypothetical protein